MSFFIICEMLKGKRFFLLHFLSPNLCGLGVAKTGLFSFQAEQTVCDCTCLSEVFLIDMQWTKDVVMFLKLLWNMDNKWSSRPEASARWACF